MAYEQTAISFYQVLKPTIDLTLEQVRLDLSLGRIQEWAKKHFDSSRNGIQLLFFISIRIETIFKPCLSFCFETKQHFTHLCHFVLRRNHKQLIKMKSLAVNLSFHA